MAAAMSWRGALCAFTLLILPGVARTALAAGASASITGNFPALEVPPDVPDGRSAPAHSSVFNIKGSGLLTIEVTYSPLYATIVSDQAYFEYLYENGWYGHAWSGAYWADGIGGRLSWIENTSSGGYAPEFSSSVSRYKYWVSNATSSLDGRLVVVPGRWYFGGGGFAQAAQTISMRLDFVADPSTISQHTDKAGGPRDNRHTKYYPKQVPCLGLPHYSVNTSLLNLVIEDTDFGCQSYGHDEALRRVWNMLPGRSGMFGNGWSFAYESSLVAKPYTSGGATLTLGSGQTAAYSVAGSSGTGTVTVNYTRDTAGRGPTLTGVIDAATGAGYYTLTDKETKLTQRYDYAGDDSGDHRYRLSSITDRNGNAISLNYNGSDRIATITDASNRQTAFTYDSNSRCTGMSTFDGRSASYQYDSAGNLTQSVDLAGNVITYAYDAKNYPTAMTVEGKTTSFAYSIHTDGTLYLSAVTEPNGKVRRYAFGPSGTTQVTEPGGGVRAYGSSNGRTTSVTDELNHTATTVYNAQYLPTSITDPQGNTTSLEYDGNGNLTKAIDPAGNATTLTYDANWNLTSVTDALGHTTSYSHDANRRLTGIVRPDDTSIQYGYDTFSLTSITDADGNTTSLQRDAALQITGVTDPLGNITRFAYNDDGDMISTTDPLGRAATVAYDAAHRPTSSVNPLNGSLGFGRNANGNLTSLTDERGKTTSMTYDSLGALASVRDPLNNTTATIVHDALGQISSVTNARGGIVSYLYDADRRITGKKYDDRSAATYEWSLNGYLTSVSDASGTRSFTRDDAGRVTAIAYPDGHTAATTYDAAGNLLSLTYADGLTVNYTYDAVNRVTGVSFAGNSLSLAYDAAGNLTGETRSNGVQSAYSYDANSQLARVAHQNGTSLVADITYTRNAAGLITEESGTWPLSAAPTAVHNATASYDDANGVVSWDGDNHTYDTDGNLIKIAGSRNLDILYDHENRPTSITWNGATTQYVYDGLGNRVQARSAAATRNFYHDLDGRLLFDVDITNSETNHYVYAGDRLVASGSSSGGYVFYHFDKTGNTLALTNSGGSVVSAFAYDPYGRVVARSGSPTTPFTYVGAYGVIEETSDLFFMKNRHYDAVTGRFLQKDPIGFAGGINLYAYVGNNPVARIDPQGLWGMDGGGGWERWNETVQKMDPETKKLWAIIGTVIMSVPTAALILPELAATMAAAGDCLPGALAATELTASENALAIEIAATSARLYEMGQFQAMRRFVTILAQRHREEILAQAASLLRLAASRKDQYKYKYVAEAIYSAINRAVFFP